MAVIFIAAASFLAPYQDGCDGCDASAAVCMDTPAFSVASPALESYMEISVCSNVTSVSSFESRTVQVLQQVYNNQPVPARDSVAQDRSLEVAPERMADYFVYALERIMI